MEPEQILRRRMFQWNFEYDARPMEKWEVDHAIEPVNSRLIDIARRTGAKVLNPLNDLSGPDGYPIVDSAGNPIYFDRSHLRASYTRHQIHFLDDITLMQPPARIRHTGK